LFGSLVLEGDPGIITTDVMRATIAFKWQMYGHRSWIRDLLRYLVFCASCISGCNLLVRMPPDCPLYSNGFDCFETEHFCGWALLLLATSINLTYLHEEVLQLAAEKLEYFYSMYNFVDASLIMLQFALLPMIAYDIEGYNQMAALTELIVLVKVAKLSRGNDRMSFLVTMLEEIDRHDSVHDNHFCRAHRFHLRHDAVCCQRSRRR